MAFVNPTQYVYADNADADELARLRLLESVADIDTARILDRIGVRAGWRCLEVAGGAGSVARMLAERVGVGGEVTAIDMDLRFLAASAGPNLKVRRADVLTDELGVEAFDLVHTRHLLAHLGERAADAVARMAAAVRPAPRCWERASTRAISTRCATASPRQTSAASTPWWWAPGAARPCDSSAPRRRTVRVG